MVRISISPTSIDVEGHAEGIKGVPPGNNIICAAVSALTLTLIDSLRIVAGIWLESNEKSGKVHIGWTYLNDKAKALIDAYLIGIRGIQGSYGQIEIHDGNRQL